MGKIRVALVTGAVGFVGRRVVADLTAAGWTVRAVVRSIPDNVPPAGVVWFPLGDLTCLDVPAWSDALTGVEAVVHLAGRAHVMNDAAADPFTEYRRTNVVATQILASAAVLAGVRRFVYMSSVKAVAESSGETTLTDDALPQPEDDYGRSKREAEVCLLDNPTQQGMSVIVLRPPLIYGPGVRANFARLIRWVARGIPLPFSAIANRRSLVFVGNLSDAVRFAIDTPMLDGKACFVTDGEDLSTADLIRRVAAALGRRALLIPVPEWVLRGAFALLGRRAEADRLMGSLALSPNRLIDAGWQPPYSLDQGLAATVREIAR